MKAIVQKQADSFLIKQFQPQTKLVGELINRQLS